ncbi:MAG: DUF3467 domain-containing protein [Proteobacteria bacterium]|nr:DUF3467 domain-containing protein [Pseudomonadota bacterium]
MPKANKQSAVQRKIEIQIVPTKEKVSERIYSNFVQVAHSLHEFTLTFCDVLPVIDNNQKTEVMKSKQIQAPIQVEIVIPSSLVEPLINAISENYERFKKSKGK